MSELFFPKYIFSSIIKLGSISMSTKKKKRKLKKSILFKTIALIVIGFSIAVFIMFIQMEILPLKYLAYLALGLIIIDGLLFLLLSRKNYKARMIGSILSIILVITFAVAMKYESMTMSFLHNISFLNIETVVYQVVVKNSNSYNTLEDIKDKKIGYVKDQNGMDKALKEISKTITSTNESMEDTSTLIDKLTSDEVDAIIIPKEEQEIYSEMISDFKDEEKVIATISVDVQKEENQKEVTMTKEPFSVYITGVDTYDGINTVARSDVNMIATVNPLTHKILLTSIPRDYYVQIYGTTGLKDKLTHAGLKGVDCSVKTIEQFLDMDINYNMKFNFTALIEFVDAMGGIDVDSPFAFTADYTEDEHIYYEFTKGINHLNGKQALAYCRERYSLREGDIARAKHQQQVIQAVIQKVETSDVLKSYASILGSIEDNFVTNIGYSNITGFIQMQLDQNPKWTIENEVLNGTNSFELTNSFPTLYSSVMLPDEKEVEEAKQKIDDIVAETGNE